MREKIKAAPLKGAAKYMRYPRIFPYPSLEISAAVFAARAALL